MGQEFTAGWKSAYQPDEDALIWAVCKEAEDEGVALSTAYQKIASELGRPVGGVGARHRKLLKDLKREDKKKTSLSESGLLVAKLKTIKRQVDRSSEKTDFLKGRIRDLESELREYKDKFRTLQAEHQMLINSVKEALGEVDEEQNEEDGNS